MWMQDPPHTLWSIWKELSLLNHGFVLILGGVCAYSLFSMATSILRLRSIRNLPDANSALIEETLTTLHDLWVTVRQVTTATLYLFALLLSIALGGVGHYFLGGGLNSFVMNALGTFRLLCVFAANIFAIFLALHLIQWFMAGLLRSASGRLDARRSSHR